MAQIKWIKIVTDIFDDEKILMIESLPMSDNIIVIWFKLLCLAGKSNNSGVFLMNDTMPYSDEMLAAIFRRDIKTVQLALKTFQEFGMVEIINNTVTIPNWSKHQTLDAYEKKKERDRIYQQNRREKQKLLAEGQPDNKESSDKSAYESFDSSMTSKKIVPLEEDREIDKEEDKEIDIDKDKEEDRDKKSSIVVGNVEVFKHFEKCGFMVSSMLMEKIATDIEIFGTKNLMDAATEAMERGKLNNYKYVIGIAQNWQTEGKNVKSNNNKTKSLTKFDNFEARKYDYDDLEKKLLGWDKEEKI